MHESFRKISGSAESDEVLHHDQGLHHSPFPAVPLISLDILLCAVIKSTSSALSPDPVESLTIGITQRIVVAILHEHICELQFHPIGILPDDNNRE